MKWGNLKQEHLISISRHGGTQVEHVGRSISSCVCFRDASILGMFGTSIWRWCGVMIVFVKAHSHVYVKKSRKAVKIIQQIQARPTSYCYFLHNKVQMVGRITVFKYNQWYHEYILDSQLTYPYSMLKKGGYWKLLCNEEIGRASCRERV